MQDITATSLYKAAKEHFESVFPNEGCGVQIKDRGFYPCNNIHEDPVNNFIINPRDLSKAMKLGEIVSILHSHTHDNATPSVADIDFCNRSELPWYIIALPSGRVRMLSPNKNSLPLLGREFVHGMVDCLSLIRDYYSQELGIVLKDYNREDGWWEDGPINLYDDLHEDMGFQKVEELQLHDVIIMSIKSKKANHAGIYVGNDRFIHHMYGMKSNRRKFGGYWEKNTRYFLRYYGTRKE